jgi:hypothetical protein
MWPVAATDFVILSSALVPSEAIKRRKSTGDVESCITWSEHYLVLSAQVET